jgi:hypothetical protein
VAYKLKLHEDSSAPTWRGYAWISLIPFGELELLELFYYLYGLFLSFLQIFSILLAHIQIFCFSFYYCSICYLTLHYFRSYQSMKMVQLIGTNSEHCLSKQSPESHVHS